MPNEKATILNLATGEPIAVMFNPEEYALEAGNSFAEIAVPGLRTPPLQYGRGTSRTLKVELFFDTTRDGSDVRLQTSRIVGLLDKDARLNAPPVLLFLWGGFQFRCVLERVGQRFTMFLADGAPRRAYLSTSFKEYEEVAATVQTGLFLAPPTVQGVVQGGDLSRLAAQALGDPGAWRKIADLNRIDNPRKVAPGLRLLVPARPGASS
jgi:hypothetical protein